MQIIKEEPKLQISKNAAKLIKASLRAHIKERKRAVKKIKSALFNFTRARNVAKRSVARFGLLIIE